MRKGVAVASLLADEVIDDALGLHVGLATQLLLEARPQCECVDGDSLTSCVLAPGR